MTKCLLYSTIVLFLMLTGMKLLLAKPDCLDIIPGHVCTVSRCEEVCARVHDGRSKKAYCRGFFTCVCDLCSTEKKDVRNHGVSPVSSPNLSH
ncbi:hypothetical protein CTI12_AA552810 [Artemisia annua]|uniref:Uncharacterized protein n=1 Tax=Artemisia annua TaxID=35608 RepID=A0A2U1KXK4_ARTAN|nr:hypothetical protein CTI12_AA552810 [Artemisia annua]